MSGKHECMTDSAELAISSEVPKPVGVKKTFYRVNDDANESKDFYNVLSITSSCFWVSIFR